MHLSENSKCPYVISDLMQSWLLEVIEADEDESGLCEEGETKEVWWGEKRESEAKRIERGPCSPASAFWTAACWMIGLKSL